MIDPDALRRHITTNVTSCGGGKLTSTHLVDMFNEMRLTPYRKCVVVGSGDALDAYWRVWRRYYRSIEIMLEFPTLMIDDPQNDLFFLTSNLPDETQQGRLTAFTVFPKSEEADALKEQGGCA
jgi:hypothetical protein